MIHLREIKPIHTLLSRILLLFHHKWIIKIFSANLCFPFWFFHGWWWNFFSGFVNRLPILISLLLFVHLLAVLLLIALNAYLTTFPDKAILMKDKEWRIPKILDIVFNFLILGTVCNCTIFDSDFDVLFLLSLRTFNLLLDLPNFPIKRFITLSSSTFFLNIFLFLSILPFEFFDLRNNLLRLLLLGFGDCFG